jgi:hypothetical protein
MTPAQRYARPQITQLSQGAMQQVEAAGKTLAAHGVQQAPMQQPQSPAQRYGHPAPNTGERSLVQRRSL